MRKEWETHFAVGLPDNMILQGCGITICQFLCRRWTKTGVDVTLRPMVVSGKFQTLSIGVTLYRFQSSSDAEAPTRVDTWTGNVDTSLRIGGTKTMNLGGHDMLTIERLDRP